MPKQIFRKRIVFSSVLVAAVIVGMAVFYISMFKMYSPPNNKNTCVMSGKVTEVCYTTVSSRIVEICLSDAEPIDLAAPYSLGNLYSTIGYDIEELAAVLEGKTIKYRRMKDHPWAVEIETDGVRIDNTNLTTHQMYIGRGAILLVVAIVLGLAIGAYIVYVKKQHKLYLKAKRKQEKKEKRALKLMQRAAPSEKSTRPSDS